MKGDVVRCRDVDDRTRAAMHELFLRQFDNVPFDGFAEDLGEKNWVLLLRRDDGALTGFSSLHVYDAALDGRSATVVYSGDTVVEADGGSDSALSYCWMGAVDHLRRRHGRDFVYWLLLVSGYRTYRFLPVYSRCYYPRFDEATPAGIQAVMDTLAQQRFGDRYDPRSGVVRLAVPAILRDGLRGIPGHRLADPNVAFFADRNPGHEQGDELVCLAVLSEDRLTPLGRRMWRKGRELVAVDRES